MHIAIFPNKNCNYNYKCDFGLHKKKKGSSSSSYLFLLPLHKIKPNKNLKSFPQVKSLSDCKKTIVFSGLHNLSKRKYNYKLLITTKLKKY